MDDFLKYLFPTYKPYIPPCGRNPYYDDPRDVKPNVEDNAIEMTQCRQCGTYFVPDGSWIRPHVLTLCEKCRGEASQ